jgi:hypothetical protein
LAPIEANTEAGPALNPADNLDGWLEKREADKEPAPEPVAAEPEKPEVPTTTEPVSWRDVVLPDDVGHEFLKGKKVADAITSWEHSQRALKEAQKEAAEAKRELEAERRRIEAEQAARKVAAERQPNQPSLDPYAEIEAKLLENPREGIRMIQERTLAEARKIAAEEAEKLKTENAKKEYERNVFDAGGRAYDTARERLGLDKDTWNDKAQYVMLALAPGGKFHTEDSLFNPDAYVDAYHQIFGQPTPVVVKPTQEVPTPPGAKKPAAAALANATPTTSPLDREDREARRVIAQYAGIDADRFIKRGERR